MGRKIKKSIASTIRKEYGGKELGKRPTEEVKLKKRKSKVRISI